MAKSTVAKALASLQFKFQAKIREVGALKKQISEGNNANVEIQRLRLRNDNLTAELEASDKALKFAEFELAQAQSAYKRIGNHAEDLGAQLGAVRSEVKNWKSLAGVLFVVGVAVGGLGYMAYLANTL